jgi:anti-sigma factor RsiW
MTHPMSPDEMHAIVDQPSSEKRRQVLEALSRDDPQTAEAIAAWVEQRSQLQALHQAVLSEPIPPSLRQAAERLSRQQQDREANWRLVGKAASVFLAFGLGWIANSQLTGIQASSPQLARGIAQREFVRQAGFAHSVYMPEKRHPVEVTASDQDHLVQWLSKRVGRPLKVPQLSSMGYELVGGRLLPGDVGARAQFMFQDAQGQRITMYLGAIDQKAGPVNNDETGFRYESGGGVPSFYWVDKGFGYALTGQIDREGLMALATLVYQQL